MNGKKAKQLHKLATSLHKGEGQVYKDYEYIAHGNGDSIKIDTDKDLPSDYKRITRQLVPCVRKTYRFLKRDYVRKQINLGVK